ncbi:MAG TPA: DUF4388 domain-containing protein [Nitriliruptorales bacterium]
MLEGTLDSFTLPDVFQLLAFTKKTGVLRLHDDEDTGNVFFRDGQVTYAIASTGRQALGRRLVGAAVVDTDTLAQALDEQKRARQDGKGLKLGQILVDRGALDESQLETFVREQIQDAVFDLMRWSDGAFAFEAGDGMEEQSIKLAVSVENLIMEGSRRLEEWDAVRKKIPSMKAIVAMAPLPGDTGVEVSLKPEEWRLLTLVDGRRTVRDLVEVFGQGEFATCKVLYGLVGAGLLEVRDPDLEGPSSIAALLQQHELLRELEDDGQSRPPPRDRDRVARPTVAQPPETPTEKPAPTPDETPADEDEEQEDEVAEPAPAAAESDRPSPDEQLTTDPSINEDLVKRLIEGVKGL